ncbi:unnamed protein product [Choristocarpus tenellus]
MVHVLDGNSRPLRTDHTPPKVESESLSPASSPMRDNGVSEKSHEGKKKIRPDIGRFTECCVKGKCFTKFKDPQSTLGKRLRDDQARFWKLPGLKHRKKFILDRVPVDTPNQDEPLRKGMLATIGDCSQLVCTKMFVDTFKVSNDLIQSCKGSERAKSSPSLQRKPREYTDTIAGVIVAFLRHDISDLAEHMPASNEKHLYGMTKKDIYEFYVKMKKYEGRKIASRSYFVAVWREYCSDLMCMKNGIFHLSVHVHRSHFLYSEPMVPTLFLA